MAGTSYRFYYNRSQDFPQCWSVDEGDSSTEINVIDVVCEVVSETRHNYTTDNEREPRAFMVCFGKLEVIKGVAYIRKV
jgi:hypothetical protein